MADIKVAFFDVDGTIVDNTLEVHRHSEMESVPKSTVNAIKKLQENGVTPFIATGRSPFMIEELLTGLGIESYICTNGQYAVMNGEVIYEDPYSNELLDRIVKVAKEKQVPLLWVPKDRYILSGENQHLVEEALHNMRLPKPIVQTDLERMDTKIYQMIAGITEDQDELFKEIKEIRIVRWQPTAVDLLPVEGSKATAIKEILKTLNLKPENAIAFGDGLNDLEMLTAVGIGVAMGNAHDITKQHADFVSKPIHEDGIEYALKHFKLI